MAFTKILGPGIHTLANFHSHNINSSGIITATKFVGDMEPGGGTGTFDSLTVTGNLGVGGTVTYTDVTNVDAVGIITAQSGINISGNGLNVISGVSTFAGVIDAQGYINLAQKIIHTGDADTSIEFDTNTIKFETQGGQRLRIHSDGKVGIATVTPNATLDIHGANSNAMLRLTESAYTNTNKYTKIYEYGGNTYFNTRNDTNYGSFIFRGEDASTTPEFLRITSTGRLGIGTGTPLASIHVNVGGGATEPLLLERTGSGSESSLWSMKPYAGNLYFRGGPAPANYSSDRFAIVYGGDNARGGDVQFYGTAAGVTSCLWDASANSLIFKDNSKAVFGDGSDLSIYWTGSRAKINALNSNLDLESDYIALKNQANSKEYLNCTNNDAVKIYFNHAQKFATTDKGISVTGEVAATQDYPNYRPILDFNFAAQKKLDPRITYTRSGPASYIDEFGIVKLVGENAPRFDHDIDTKESKGLLIEESRTNSMPYGTTPGDNWSGSIAGSTLIENTTEVKAPDGTYTATKWEFTTTDPYLYHQQTLSANTTYTMSVWVKAGTNMSGDVLQMRMGAGPYSTNANSTLSTDGSWKRLTFTKTVGGSDETDVNIGFEPQTASGNPAAGDSIYIWGAQLEIGSFVTSFIPTYGLAATRGADQVTVTGSDFTDFYNDLEGTFAVSHSILSGVPNGENCYVFEVSDGGATHVAFRYNDVNSSFSNKPSFHSVYNSGLSASMNATGTYTRGEIVKGAMTAKQNSFKATWNGETIQTDGSGSVFGPAATGQLAIGRYHPSAGYELNGHIQRMMYWPKQLSSDQLVNLTS